MRENSECKINIPYHNSKKYFVTLEVYNAKIFDPDPDPGCSACIPGSGGKNRIRDKHPGSGALDFSRK
jgi:hypothetical protein